MRGREGGFTLEGKLGRVCVVSVNGVLVTEASVIYVCQGSLSGARCQGWSSQLPRIVLGFVTASEIVVLLTPSSSG